MYAVLKMDGALWLRTAQRTLRCCSCRLSCDGSWCDWRNRFGRHPSQWCGLIAVHCRSGSGLSLSLRAVSADVANLTASVAGLTRCVQRTTIRCSAVSGDVSKLAASIAFHGLSLTVAREVIRSTTLVARRRTISSKTTAHATTIASSCGSAGSTACRWCSCSIGIRAVALSHCQSWSSNSGRMILTDRKMTRLAARIASPASRTSTQA